MDYFFLGEEENRHRKLPDLTTIYLVQQIFQAYESILKHTGGSSGFPPSETPETPETGPPPSKNNVNATTVSAFANLECFDRTLLGFTAFYAVYYLLPPNTT
jgi:hypothetical protein